MDTKEKLRQNVVNLFLKKEFVRKIALSLLRNRQWAYKWVSRHENNPTLDWYKNGSIALKVCN